MNTKAGISALILLLSSINVFANGWEYTENIDAFDDTDRSFVSPAEWNVGGGSDPIIGFKCMKSGLDAIAFHTYMSGSNSRVKVQLRVDKNSAYGPAYWDLAVGNKVSFMPKSDIVGMINEMKAGNSLAIKITDPFDGDSVSGKMSLVGFSAAISKLGCYK